jgi:hypothetical protein
VLTLVSRDVAEDWILASFALGTPFHGDIYTQFDDQSNSEARSEVGQFGQDNTDYRCPLFTGTGTGLPAPNNTNSTVNRASVIIHEMWHHWQYDKITRMLTSTVHRTPRAALV